MTETIQFPTMRIYPYGHPFLRDKCAPVSDIPSIQSVVRVMISMCERHPEWDAVGLSAPQIGIRERFFIFRRDNNWVAVANPEILETSAATTVCLEGCVSIPRFRATIERPDVIGVRFTEVFSGEVFETELRDAESTIFQHEVDHLNGILITDHASKNDLRRGGRALKHAQAMADKLIRYENRS